MQTPTRYPDDDPSVTTAIDTIEAAGFVVRRPARDQLKVGPYNFWPSTGSITSDHVHYGRAFRWKGLQGFLHALNTAKGPLPRRSRAADALPSGPQRRRSSLVKSDAAAAGADAGAGVEDVGGAFDTPVDDLPQPMRQYAHRLIEEGLLCGLVRSGVTLISMQEFAAASSGASEPPF